MQCIIRMRCFFTYTLINKIITILLISDTIYSRDKLIEMRLGVFE